MTWQDERNVSQSGPALLLRLVPQVRIPSDDPFRLCSLLLLTILSRLMYHPGVMYSGHSPHARLLGKRITAT